MTKKGAMLPKQLLLAVQNQFCIEVPNLQLTHRGVCFDKLAYKCLFALS
jgi:hypothetical protein